VVQLAKVITPENSAEVIPQFFHRSKQEAMAVAVEVCPAAVIPRREVVTKALTELPRAAPFHLGESPRPSEHRDSTEPLTPNLQRLHITVSKQFIEKLEAARKGQGHAQHGASAEKIIEAALDLLLAQQAQRRAEVKKPQRNPRPAKNPDHVPAAVRRAVWSRDEGKCQWPLDSGGICGSTLRLEIDHVIPRGRGGPSTVDNSRLACKFHNQLAARQVYGDECMNKFTNSEPRTVPIVREPVAPWGQPPLHPPRSPLRPILVSRRRRHSQQRLRRGAEDRANPSAMCLGAIQPRTPSPEDQRCGEG